MRKKYTLIGWHAGMFLICVLIASRLAFTGIFPMILATWGLLHGIEFCYFVYNYRYIPRLRDFTPVMLGFPQYNVGGLGFKFTSFIYFDFYKLWGGEIRCFCRANNQRYTLFGPGFIRKRK